MARQPTIYIPHGGGPWPFVDVGFGSPEEWRALRLFLENLYERASGKLQGVLCVTAHFEGSIPLVTSAEHPSILYDYGGFPPEAYRIQWPAPGSPTLASRVRELFNDVGIESNEAPKRGFDHGTFVPLKLADPTAAIPTVQLSLRRDLDPEFHLDMGRALAPLRDEGILIIGSGSSYHNMRAFGSLQGRSDSIAFDQWLGEEMSRGAFKRRESLIRWAAAPSARACHPREEHLLPLHVVAGAAEDDEAEASFPFEGFVLGARMRAVQFG